MDLERNADKLRRASERRARDGDKNQLRLSERECDEPHRELVNPEHSNGRPAPNPAKDEQNGASNAGTDAP